MSTKASIAYGDDFHLYHDGWGDEREQFVYLDMRKCVFTADSSGNVTVQIPMAVWEFIRRFKGLDFNLAKMTDTELKKEVERRVDARIEADRKAIDSNKPRFFRCANVPRSRQIREFYRGLDEARAWQRKVLRDIKHFEYGMSPEALEEHNRKARRLRAARIAARARWDKTRRGIKAAVK